MDKYVIAQCPTCHNEYTSLFGDKYPICPFCREDMYGIYIDKTPIRDEAGRALTEADDLLLSKQFKRSRELYLHALTLCDEAHAHVGAALAAFKVEFDGKGAPKAKKSNGKKILDDPNFVRALELTCLFRQTCIKNLGHSIDGLHAFTAAQSKIMHAAGFRLIGAMLESYDGKDTDVTVPDGVTEIADFAFMCSSVKSVHIPSSVEKLSAFSFYGRTIDVTVDPDSPYFAVKSGCLIDKRTKTLVVCFAGADIPKDGSVTVIGRSAFQERRDIEELTVPKGVTAIDENAFDCCTSMRHLSLPYTLETIGHGALVNCNSLKKVAVDALNTHIRFESGCLIENASGTLIRASVGCTIPSDVTTIARAAFGRGHKSLHFHATVTSGIENGFCGSKLETLTVASDNPVYRAENNCIIDKKTNTLVRGCKASVIPTGVTAIGDFAFRDCDGMHKLVVPDGITSIGVGAFDGCGDLSEVVLPDTVKSVSAHAFEFCTNLEKIDLGHGLEYIGNNAFDICNSLNSVTIPASVTHIEAGAFSDCENLKEVILEDKTGWRVNTVKVDPDDLDNDYLINLLTGYADLTKDSNPKS